LVIKRAKIGDGLAFETFGLCFAAPEYLCQRRDRKRRGKQYTKAKFGRRVVHIVASPAASICAVLATYTCPLAHNGQRASFMTCAALRIGIGSQTMTQIWLHSSDPHCTTIGVLPFGIGKFRVR
jgi:hypothetical protein